jgi:hypothetical protein
MTTNNAPSRNLLMHNCVTFLILYVCCIVSAILLVISIFGEWGALYLFVASLLLPTFAIITLKKSRPQPVGLKIIIVSLLFGLLTLTLAPKQLFGSTTNLIALVRFYIHKTEYTNKVKSTNTGNNILILFNWGGFMNNPVYLIFDESDGIAPDKAQRSNEWFLRYKHIGEFTSCSWSSHQIEGHFYVVRFSC